MISLPAESKNNGTNKLIYKTETVADVGNQLMIFKEKVREG